MAWLSTHNATNKIVDTERTWTEKRMMVYRYPGSAFVVSTLMQRSVTEVRYRYVGMTEAAADTCLAAMQAAGYEAEKQRENDGGAYQVAVVEVTEGTWELVPTDDITTTTTTTTT